MQFFPRLKYILLLALILATGHAIAAEESDSTYWLYSAQHRIDSLKRLINLGQLTEKQEVEHYRDIAALYHNFQLDSSIVYNIKSKRLAEKLNEHNILMDSYINLGISYSFQGNYDLAFDCFDQSNRLAVKYNNKEMEALGISLTGFAYAKQGKHNTAIDYYLKYLKISESEGWAESCVRALANLSEINRRLGNSEPAIQYLKLAEEICDQSKFDPDFRYLWWIPQICNEYAFNYLNKGDYENALRYAMEADSINPPFGMVNRCYTKSLLASIYLRLNNFDLALQYAKESYKEADILKDVSLYANAGKILSDVYLAQKRFREAETEALKVWQIDSTNIDESRAIAKNIAMANIYMGNTEKAAYYLNKYSEMNVLYSEKSFHTTVSDMTVKYETEKKEVRIGILEKEKKMYVWLGITGILFAVALGIVLLQIIRNTRKEQQFVAAKAVQEGEMGERARIAEDLHDRLGGSLSAVKMEIKNAESLQDTSEKLDACIKEVREIVQNIMPRSLRMFGMKGALEDFCVQFPNLHFHFFGEDRRIADSMEYAVFCCAKELVNNSIKHSGAANINLQLVQSKEHVSLIVQDDGCGFDEKTVVKGNGLENIRNRVASCKGKIDIASSQENGTETVIELKVES